MQVMGYSVRSAQWRYTEWFKFDGSSSKADFNQTLAMELYDHSGDDGSSADAYEQVNVVTDPANAAVVATHAKAIRDGWRKQLPVL